MTNREIVSMVLEKSERAYESVSFFLREVISSKKDFSPQQLHVIARFALEDPEAVWTPEERAVLKRACSNTAFWETTEESAKMHRAARVRIRELQAASGLSTRQMETVFRLYPALLDRVFDNLATIRHDLIEWVLSIDRIDLSDDHVSLVLKRPPDDSPGGQPMVWIQPARHTKKPKVSKTRAKATKVTG